jgi:hypothetical protein
MPLSRRQRPHRIAGGIAQFVVRAGGRVAHFYCLLDPSGKPIWSRRAVVNDAAGLPAWWLAGVSPQG